jgi:hypothetical protein
MGAAGTKAMNSINTLTGTFGRTLAAPAGERELPRDDTLFYILAALHRSAVSNRLERMVRQHESA